MLASYATWQSRGRLHKEEGALDAFLEDRKRIIYSRAFRRLEHKTQVFMNNPGDHYRSRMTHSLEVATVARYIARQLHLNEDLAECIAFAHDLGHPPFGHAGEDTLNDILKPYGGFDHNLHTLKIVNLLEKNFTEFPGINLTWEVLEGLAKHNGALKESSSSYKSIMQMFGQNFDLELSKSQPSLEAQVASLADDITYCAHDIEDAIRATFLQLESLLEIDAIRGIYKKIEESKIPQGQFYTAIAYNLRNWLISDLLQNTKERISKMKIEKIDQVRSQTEFIVGFTEEAEDTIVKIKSFLMQKVYQHHKIKRMRFKAERILTGLFQCFLEYPGCIPNASEDISAYLSEEEKAEMVSYYVAGMTDRFAISEYEKLYNLSNFWY